jgi:hypothetical protein
VKAIARQAVLLPALPPQDGRAAAEARLAHKLAALSACQALAGGQVVNATALVSRYCPSVLEVRVCGGVDGCIWTVCC